MTEPIGSVDEYGRVLLNPDLPPGIDDPPNFGRWRGGLIHPDRPWFMIRRQDHPRVCVFGWVSSTGYTSTGRSGKWWGPCWICHNDRYEGSKHKPEDGEL